MKKLLTTCLLVIVATACKKEELIPSKELSCSGQLTTIGMPVGSHTTIEFENYTTSQVNSLLKEEKYDYYLVGCVRTK